MAGNIVELADFIGSSDVQKGKFTSPDFDNIRDEWTDHYIYLLLGADLGVLFLANLDVNGVPVEARFLTIYNKIIQEDNFQILESRGIKYMIKTIVWFYYARNNNVDIQISGNKVTLGENSDVSTDSFTLVRNYNKGIETGRQIQRFIRLNSGTYPEYNGQKLKYATPS